MTLLLPHHSIGAGWVHAPSLCRPDDVMLKRTHDETVLLHCFLWPLVTFLVGVLIVALTACARSLAARAEAIQRKKHS